MVGALGACLDRRSFACLGLLPQPVAHRLGWAGSVVNAVPEVVRSAMFARLGWHEAVPPARLGELRSDEVAAQFVSRYPRRRCRLAAFGSSNGAVVHLCAAVGAPWLPQTFLVGVRHGGVRIDEPDVALEWGERAAVPLLRANPDLVLHHMHDPNQDELMLRGMSYFRLKWRRLPRAYLRFLEDVLLPGGTLLVVDCGLRWPVTTVSDRHVFQHGAAGGLEAADYRACWGGPETDSDAAEAEWGLDADVIDDLDALAAKRNVQLVQMSFTHPEDASGMVADLYRSWYRAEGLPADRLVAESFILLDPWTVMRRGWVPLWLLFPVAPSARVLETSLGLGDIKDVRILLFAHGARSVGIAPPGRWRQAAAGIADARLLAVDESAFPADFGVYFRYGRELSRLPGIGPRAPLALDRLEEFAAANATRYGVAWA